MILTNMMINFRGKKVDIRIELIAALTTYVTAAYIIVVNPQILSAAGMDKSALIVVTCLATALATIILGLWANVPFMMAPGMGLNVFFTYTLVIGKGVPWETALGVVFISGAMFLFLTIIGAREKIVQSIPESLRMATSVGIGLFIAFIGFRNMGLVIAHKETLVSLGEITRHVMFGGLGLLMITGLEIFRIRGAIFISIIAITLIAIILGDVSLPDKFISAPPSIGPIFFKLNIVDALQVSLLASIFSFMYVDLFDSLGTILAVSSQAGFIKKDKTIPNIGRILSIDAIATMSGSLLGTSTTTAYVESASGVAAGGRSGLTAIFIGILFFLSIFIVPLIAIVPPYATAPALVIVGIYMMRDVNSINFFEFDEAVPAFLTFILIPLTYSISTGIMFGFLSYVFIKLLFGRIIDLNWVLVIIAILSLINLWAM